ncbi:MAG: DUF4810 domain-containing protein [Bacteroidaceae bacterium]|nr:DUF4810 domain-containing protein [Bacteroidaceae bacterium]
MKKTFSMAALAILALSVTSCVTTNSLYSWYGYEDAVYTNYKKPTDKSQAKVLEQYRAVIEKQKGTRGAVPPGLYAEYGFLLYKTGSKEEGINYMKQEIALYPESQIYISRIINQLEK